MNPIPTTRVVEIDFTELVSGLRCPEGPVALADGSLVVVEMIGERLTHIAPDGTTTTIADMPGGPNGAALGPDGAMYVCNNGRAMTAIEMNGMLFPGPFDPSRYLGGSIQRVDMDSGQVTDLYRACEGRPLRAPNDLVMDGNGGFWFTDNGITDLLGARTRDVTAIYYARCDGSSIREAIFPADSPNGIGLSADGTQLFWAETHTGRVRHRTIIGVGEVAPDDLFGPSDVIYSTPGSQLLDSLAVDAEGWINVGTLIGAGITAIRPDGAFVEFVPTADPITTNLCFGGPDLRTVYVTASSTGRILVGRWNRPGLRLAHHSAQ